jgi:hypothetical protein
MDNKNTLLEKMNRRHGVFFGDYLSMTTWLRRLAERLERKGAPYAQAAAEARADYEELLGAS